MRSGQCKYAPLIEADGGIVNDPVLLRIDEDRFWLSLADSDAGLWARGVAWGSDFDVEISEPEVFPVQVQGPKAKDVVSRLFGDEVLEMPYYHCMNADLDGIPVVIGRTGWTGEIGYEIYLREAARGDELWERIMEAGREDDIRPIAALRGPPNRGRDLQLRLRYDARQQPVRDDRAASASSRTRRATTSARVRWSGSGPRG